MLICIYCVIFITWIRVSFCIKFLKKNKKTWKKKLQSFLHKACVCYFLSIFFNQMIALQKLWKMFFIWSKKLFWFSRYSNFCIFVFLSFFHVSHCFRGWFKKNLKVYNVINCLNKNLITHFVWFLEKKKRYDI